MRQATYLDFPLEEYRARRDRLRQSMEEAGIDALLLTMRDNVEYLSGFTTVSWRLLDKRFWVLVPVDDDPVLTVDVVHEVNAQETSWIEDVRIWGRHGKTSVNLMMDVFSDLGLDSATVGMELGLGMMLHMSQNELSEIKGRLGSVEFVDASHLIHEARMPKSLLEVERIEEACRITCEGIKLGLGAAQEGVTEREVLSIIVGEWLKQGADTAYNSTNHGYLSVQAGRAFQMTPSPVERKIRKGDLIQVDGGAVYKGYCADIYRNAIVGTDPPRPLNEAADGCKHVLETTLQAIRPGVTSAEIAAATEAATAGIGFQNRRRLLMDAISVEKGPMIGHGIGFTVHELPFICRADHTVWTEGMCGALELSFGDEESGYVVLEDDFVVTESGNRLLTPLDRNIRVV